MTPGLINTHAHLYRYAYPISVDPDAVGFPAGVTTAIDAGSGGASTFLGFRKYVIDTSPLRIYAMLNISTVGNFGNELYMGLGNINAKAAIRVINEHKDRIVAIKVRINGNHNDLATRRGGVEAGAIGSRRNRPADHDALDERAGAAGDLETG